MHFFLGYSAENNKRGYLRDNMVSYRDENFIRFENRNDS